MRRSAWSVLLILLPASVLAQTVTPDASGAYTLAFDVHRATAGDARLTLDVVRDDAGDVARGTRDLGTRTLPAGPSRIDVSFLPAEGAGDYAVTLLVDGASSGTARFTVAEGAGASRDVSWSVPDEPTFLNLTSDTVNADGKLKLPGDALLTRATLEDANGVADVERVAFGLFHGATLIATGDAPFTRNGTRADVEVSFTRSPLPAGNHTLVMQATRAGAVLAQAQRTFLVKDVAASANLTIPALVADADRVLAGAIVLADRNGVDPPPALELRLYKGSTRVEGRGLSLELGAWSTLPDRDGAGRAEAALTLRVPNGTVPGTYRASAYAGSVLVGSAPFDVLPLPRFASAATAPGDVLVLALNLTAPGVVEVRTDEGVHVAAALPAGANALDVPTTAARVNWTATLRARVDGPVQDAATGEWRSTRVALNVTPAGRSALWRVEAEGADLAGATSEVQLTRWDGATLSPRSTFNGTHLRLDVPREAGRYQARLVMTTANGTRAETTWTLDVAPWIRVALGEPNVTQSEARIPVRNEGGVDVRALLVEVEGARILGLETPSGLVAPIMEGGRARFDVVLAPDAVAFLVLAPPPGPLAAGDHAAHVRVLAKGARA